MSVIWLISQTATTPQTGYGGRTHYLARELVKLGHQVTVISARNHHLLWNKSSDRCASEKEDNESYSIAHIPTLKYHRARDKRRVIHWFIFALFLPFLRWAPGEKPDAILYSSPSLIGFLGAEQLAKRAKAKLVFEVRDLWPLTLTEIGGYSKKNVFIRFLQWVEDRAYSRADRVVSNLEGAVNHMVEHGLNEKKFSWISNGYCREEFDASADAYEGSSYIVPTGKFVVGYLGTLGHANSLDTLIAAADKLREHDDIAFLIVGQGSEKEHLINEASRLRLSNLTILDPVPKKQIYSILKTFDVCALAWKKSALYQFGNGANKIYEYLFSGKPIVQSYSGLFDLVSTYDAGITSEAENSAQLAEAILRLKNMSAADREQLGSNGKAAAITHHEYGSLARKLEDVLLG